MLILHVGNIHQCFQFSSLSLHTFCVMFSLVKGWMAFFMFRYCCCYLLIFHFFRLLQLVGFWVGQANSQFEWGGKTNLASLIPIGDWKRIRIMTVITVHVGGGGGGGTMLLLLLMLTMMIMVINRTVRCRWLW